MQNPDDLKPGTKVRFWQTIRHETILREGTFKGYSMFSGHAIVQTGIGAEAYTHYIRVEKLILDDPNQPELPF